MSELKPDRLALLEWLEGLHGSADTRPAVANALLREAADTIRQLDAENAKLSAENALLKRSLMLLAQPKDEGTRT